MTANPFDAIDPTSTGTDKAAAPAVNPFDQIDPNALAPDDSPSFGGAFARSAARSAIPSLTGLAGVGAGAELGGAIGSFAGPIGTLVGGFAGGVGGMFAGSAAGQAAQDYGVSQLPQTWRDPIDKSAREDEEKQGTASFLGGLLPVAATMNPFGAAEKGAALAANATTMQRIMASPLTARLFGGAIMGGMELGQEAVSGQPVDWSHVAMSTAFGVAFNRPNAIGEAIEGAGARPARALIGKPGAEAAPTPPPESAPAATGATDSGIPMALSAEPEAKPPPTIAQARDAKVAGPGITEDVHTGSQKQNPTAEAHAQEQASLEQSLIGPEKTPDIHAVAERMAPETIAAHDEAIKQRDTLENLASEAAGTPAAAGIEEHLAAAQAKVSELEPQVAAAYRRAAEALGHETIPPEPIPPEAGAPLPGEPEIQPAQPTGEGEAAPTLLEAAKAPKTVAEQKATIAADTKAQLMATGIQEDVAEATARLRAAYYATRAARFGGKLGTAEELYRREAAHIIGPNGRPPPREPAQAGRPPAPEPVSTAQDDAVARGKADSLGLTKLIDGLSEKGALPKEIADVVGHKMNEAEIAAAIRAKPEDGASVVAEAEPVADNSTPVSAAFDARDKIDALTPAEQKRELPKFTPAAGDAVSARTDGGDAPAGVFMFDPVALNVDAKRFQFKSGGDNWGVTGALRSVSKWDAAKAQAIMVWEDLAGKLWVADGHQRAGLARRLTEQGKASGIELPGILYREKDGISADDIRAIAAVTNIANGSGTALDGAKVLRARPDLMDGSLPLTAGKGQQAANLAALGDEPFRMVVNDVVPEHYGAIVGQLIPKDEARQIAAIKAIARFEPRSVEEAAALVQRVAQAEIEKAEEGRQTSMFGDLETPESTAGEEMRIVGKAIKDLKKDKALFSRVIANAERIEETESHIERASAQSVAADAETFARVLASDAYSAGPVREELRKAARELKSGQATIGEASARILSAIRTQVEENGLSRAGARGGPAESEGARAEGQGAEAGQERELAQRSTEPGPEGTQQTLIPGVEPVTDKDRIMAAAAKPLRGGDADLQHDGLFGDAKDQRELFQQTGDPAPASQGVGRDLAQSAYGKITFPPKNARPYITIFRDANASTAVHELGHEWLEDMFRDAQHPDAPDGLKADANIVSSWIKAEPGKTIPTRSHEKFARAFEQYLREGRAPSKGLALVFARFRNWLIGIYQTVKSLGAPINNDIRGVFDRLLAEDQRATVIAPEKARGPELHHIHEADAAETSVEHAEPVADRTTSEAERHEADLHPEIAHEVAPVVARIEAEQQAEKQQTGVGEQPAGAGAGAEPGGQGGEGAGAAATVVEGGGGAGPEHAVGGGGAEPGKELGGGVEPVQQGTGGTAGPEQRPGNRQSSGSGQPNPEPVDSLGKPEPEYLDKAGNIRLDNINADTPLKDVIREVAAQNDGFIGNRRGVVTDQQVIQGAYELLGRDPTFMERKRLGDAFNAEEIKAMEIVCSQSAANVHALSMKAAEGTEEDVIAFSRAIARHQMLQAKWSQGVAESGRATRANQKLQELWDPATSTIDQHLKGATGRTLYQMKKLAKLFSAYDTTAEISKLADDMKKPKFADMVLEYWINGLISGPATHVTYSIGNTILAAVKAGPDTLTAAAIGALRGRSERVYAGETGAQFRGLARSIAPGLEAAASSFRAGLTARLPSEKTAMKTPFQMPGVTVEAPRINEDATFHDAAASAFGILRGVRDAMLSGGALLSAGGIKDEPLWGARYNGQGAIPDFTFKGVGVLPIGTMARVPSRFISAIHAFFRTANYSMEKSALAYRRAMEEGAPDIAARVGELWQNPPEDMMTAATKEATDMTLMGPGGDFTRNLARLTNTSIGGVKWFKFVDPFVHISSNIIEKTLIERTPVGAILSGELRADLMGRNGAIAQDRAQARMLVGSAMALGFGGLAASGYASGSGPSDPRKAAMWRMAGNQAHSVRVGDVWYQVNRLGPMGMLLGISADMYEVAHIAESGDLLKAGAMLQHAITQNILDESFMRGPADLIKAVEDPGRYGEAYIRNMASSFVPYSVGMAQMARAMDPYTRQAVTVMDAIKRKIPGESETLMARRDVWGELMPSPDALIHAGITAIYETQMSRDPVNLALLSLGIAPAQVPKSIRGVPLDPQQHDDFARLAGRMAKMRLDAIVKSAAFQTWPGHVRHDVIVETIKQSRETARGLLMMKFPSIMAQATKAKQDLIKQEDEDLQ